MYKKIWAHPIWGPAGRGWPSGGGGRVRHKGERTLVKLPLHVNKERPCPATDGLVEACDCREMLQTLTAGMQGLWARTEAAGEEASRALMCKRVQGLTCILPRTGQRGIQGSCPLQARGSGNHAIVGLGRTRACFT